MKQLYLDTDDDITSVINAITAADQRRVALIPPKRSTTLQSVVNLKLLQKAAREADKEIVLITREAAILNLAAQVKLLAAPNLEAEPIVPEVLSPSEEPLPMTITAAAVSDTDLNQTDKAAASVPVAPAPTVIKAPVKSGKIKKSGKVPDFDKFKKYGLLIILAVILLGAGLWYGLTKAPRAVLTISGQTAEVQANFGFQTKPEAETVDLEDAVLPAERREAGRTLTTTFKATGKKMIGERSSGEVAVTNCEGTTPITIEKGTALTATNGLVFRALESVSVPGSSAAAGFVCAADGQASVPVQADKIGEQYNIGPTNYSVAGYSSNNVSGQGGNMDGGQQEEVSVVAESDVAAARQQLLEEQRQAVKAELEQQFNEQQFIIDASFTENVSAATPEPAVGGRGNEGRLILQVSYGLTAVIREDLEELWRQRLLESAESNDGLGVVDIGLETAEISAAEKADQFRVKTTGRLGPDIDQEALKTELAGVTYTRAIEIIESKPNVTKALVDLSPFWVSKVPSDPQKVEIKFEIDQSNETDSRN